MAPALAVTLNALGLYAIALVLAIAFGAQLILTSFPARCACCSASSSPCWPSAPMLNVRFGPRPSHYALSLLVATAGAAFAMRQILLHMMPGDPGYGSALLGYHYYTWAFIGFAVAISRSQPCCCSTVSSQPGSRCRRSAPSRAPRCGW